MTVLQLDTGFPRVPGDVGCPDTYIDPIEVIRLPGATVAHVVQGRPDLIDICPFEHAVQAAMGEVIVTSCGFLSYWQTHLASLTDKPFISSALVALDTLTKRHPDNEILTVTFDADSLSALHLGTHHPEVIGLPPNAHLRQVISHDLKHLKTARAAQETVALVHKHQTSIHKHILLECTNLPPYAPALRKATGLPVTDILTCIEDVRPGTVSPEFLPDQVDESP